MERAFHLCQTGRPGPVLVDVPMDFFSADLPVDAFSQHARRRSSGPGSTPATADAHRRGAGRRQAAGALCRRRRAVGARHQRAGGARRGARRAGGPHADGEGLPAPRPSAAARPDRVLGHADRQREVPHRRPDRRGRHAAGRGQLELAGTPRFTFDIPPTRLMHIDADLAEIGRNYQTEIGVVADARLALAALAEAAQRPPAPPTVARCARRSPAAARSSPPTGRGSGPPISSRCAPSAS